MTNLELADSIRNNLFAKRHTVNEALEFAAEVIARMPNSEQIAATTALMVVLNTVADQINSNEKNR